MSVLPGTEGGAHVRWLLLGSLALNLFFVGAAGAVAFRYSSPVPLRTVAHIDHNLATRFDRIAASLPPADGDIMRAQLHSDAEKVAAAQADLRLSQDDVRKSLRAQPFDADAMRAAMAAESHGARKFRSSDPRHDRRRGRQNVGGGPHQARRLAGRARQRTAAALADFQTGFKPRFGVPASRSQAGRVPQ